MDLVLLTASYPYGDKEAFLEAEIDSLAAAFENVQILSFADASEPLMRSVPQNVKSLKVKLCGDNRLKLSNFLFLMEKDVFNDILFTRKEYKYSFRRIVSNLSKQYYLARKCYLPLLRKYNTKTTIFYSYWFSHLSYALACLKKEKPEAVCITRAHRFDNFIDWNACNMRHFILKHINAVYPISCEGKKEIENKMLKFFPDCKPNLEVCHLGVKIPDSRDLALASGDHIFHVVSCSYVWAIKRLDIIIDTLEQIDDIQIQWTHFGAGTDYEAIKQLAQEKLASKPNIKYKFRGQVPHDEIIAYYRSYPVDLFMNTSDHEGIPVSMMEAMAVGITSVARDVGGNSELLENGVTGYLLPPNASSQDFARIIHAVYNAEPEQLERINSEARKHIEKNFAESKVYADFICRIQDDMKKSCL